MQRRDWLLTLSLATALCLAPSLTSQSTVPSCVRYEPDTVRLTGLLERRTFPGAPNSKSVWSGDAPEVGLYLALQAPLCTYGGGGSRMNEPHKGVRLVQLVLASGQLAAAAPHVGSQVTTRGTLFSATTGHPHTPLLLTVVSTLQSVNDAQRLTHMRAWAATRGRERPRDSVVKRELPEFSEEGGELTARYAGDTLRELDVEYAGETGRASEQFLFRDRVPYFYSQTEERYDRALSGHVVRSYTTRLYFDDDRLIRWVDSTGKSRDITGPAAEEHALDALRSSRALERCARNLAGSIACESSARNDSTR